jgi:hypothetical protein
MMNWIDSLFGGGRAQAAGAMQDEIGQGMSNMQGDFNKGFGFLSPFMQREPGLYQQYLTGLNQGQDPSQLYNQFASSYKESPEALAQVKVGQNAANNASAASGMLGSGAEQTAAANLAQSTRSADFDKYMNNMFGIRSQYLSGIGGLQNQGLQAALSGAQLSGQEGDDMQKYYEDMAGARAAQQTGQAGGLSNLFGQGLGFLFGGGEAGGLGSALGSALTGGTGSLAGMLAGLL